MNINLLLESLDNVRQTSATRWLACCPAHDDKTPSLQITQNNDRVLIHCFAGCGGNDILESVGLDFSVLYPEDQKTDYERPKYRKPVLEDEFFLAIYQSGIRKGIRPLESDTSRYKQILTKTYRY